MTVWELREKLADMPQDISVFVWGGEFGWIPLCNIERRPDGTSCNCDKVGLS
jgi:hypothetical protein